MMTGSMGHLLHFMAIFFVTIYLLNARHQRNFHAASQAIKISERDGGNIIILYLRLIEGPSAKTGYLQFWPKFGYIYIYVWLKCLITLFN
jgi:hypothetical protein